MKVRVLRKLLNDTKYILSNHKEYIAVGSPLCHKLISVHKETLAVLYALGKPNPSDRQELAFIDNKLHELIASGEIRDIIDGSDEVENPLPVFSYDEDGAIKEGFTDEYGWPNVTLDGETMYENVWFKTRDEAISAGLRNAEAWVANETSVLQEKEQQVRERQERLERAKASLAYFQSLNQ